MKYKLSIMSINHLQIYNSIIEVAAGVFGGDDKNKDKPVKINDLSAEEAVATMNRVFKMAGKP